MESGCIPADPPRPEADLPQVVIHTGPEDGEQPPSKSRWPHDAKNAEALISLFIHKPGLVTLEGSNDAVSRVMDFVYLLAPRDIRRELILDGLAVEVANSRYIRQARASGSFPPPLSLMRVPSNRGIPAGLSRRECGTVMTVRQDHTLAFRQRRKKAAAVRGLTSMAMSMVGDEQDMADAALLIDLHGKLQRNQLREGLQNIRSLSEGALAEICDRKEKELTALLQEGLEEYRSSGTRAAAKKTVKAIVRTGEQGIIERMAASELIRPVLMKLAEKEEAVLIILVELALNESPELLRRLLASRSSRIRARAMRGVRRWGNRDMDLDEMRAILDGLSGQENGYGDIWTVVACQLSKYPQYDGPSTRGVREVAGLLLSKADPIWEDGSQTKVIVETIKMLSGWLPRLGYSMRKLNPI